MQPLQHLLIQKLPEQYILLIAVYAGCQVLHPSKNDGVLLLLLII